MVHLDNVDLEVISDHSRVMELGLVDGSEIEGEAWRPVVKEKHGDLDKVVCASTPSTPQCEEYARRRIMIIRFRVLVIIADRCPTIDQEPLSIDFMAWGWTDSYRPSHLHSFPSHALHDKITGGISEGIFTANSRELYIHPIAPAQAS